MEKPTVYTQFLTEKPEYEIWVIYLKSEFLGVQTILECILLHSVIFPISFEINQGRHCYAMGYKLRHASTTGKIKTWGAVHHIFND